MSMSWTSERARVASLCRSRKPNDPDLVAARGNLKVARLENHIKRAINSTPPSTQAQRDHLKLLFKGGDVK